MRRHARRKPRPAGYHWDAAEMARQPDGGRSCRWCRRPVAKGRLNWCADPDCLLQWKFRTRKEVFRSVVYARDRGVCSACGLRTDDYDLKRLELQRYYAERIACHLATGEDWRRWRTDPETRVITDPSGAPYPPAHWKALYDRALPWRAAHRVAIDEPPWQADHVVPVADGGDWFDLANIRTLCVPCHRGVTAVQNSERAARRRAAKRAG